MLIKKHNHDDNYYMKKAFEQAKKAEACQEVPIGAIVVNDIGAIIGRGYNLVESKHCQLWHAEVNAIVKATKKIGDWRLQDCRLYVTLEPCLMCMGLIRLSRINRVVFAAPSKFFSYQLDKSSQGPLYSKSIEVTGGIESELGTHILKEFFKRKRERHA